MSPVASALDPLQRELVKRIARIQQITQHKGNFEEPPDTPVAEAHDTLCKSAEALAQQLRAFRFLVQDGTASAEDAAGVVRDLTMAVDMYDSWVGTLLRVVLPVVRKTVGNPCCMVLQSLSAYLSREVGGQGTALDVGKVTTAIDALTKLQTSGSAVVRQTLVQNAKLARDAVREVREAAAEAKAGGGLFGMDDDDDDGGAADDDDEDEGELLADDTISAPLQQLVSSAHALLSSAAKVDLDRVGNTSLNMLLTCANATSTCVDATVACAHEEDAKGLSAHAASLARVLSKLFDVLEMRCGVAPSAQRPHEAALAELTAACAKVQAAEGVAALSIS